MRSREGFMRHTLLGGAACIALYLFVEGVGASAIPPSLYDHRCRFARRWANHTDGHQQPRRHRRIRGNG